MSPDRAEAAAWVPDGNRTVMFVHIPKTGGMTFRNVLQQIYGPGFHYCLSSNPGDLIRDMQMFGAVEVHQALSDKGFHYTHEHLMKTDASTWRHLVVVFALFRDPIDHYLSLFGHLQQHRSLVEPLLASNRRPFPDTLSRLITAYGGNHQLLGFLGDNRAWLGAPATSDTLAEALDLLDRLEPFVGTTDRYADFLHTFECVTGRSMGSRQIRIVNRNSMRRDPPIDESTRQRLSDVNALDVEFMRHIRARVASQRERFGPAPGYTFC